MPCHQNTDGYAEYVRNNDRNETYHERGPQRRQTRASELSDGVVVGIKLLIRADRFLAAGVIGQSMEINRGQLVFVRAYPVGELLHGLYKVARGCRNDLRYLLAAIGGVGRTEIEVHPVLMNEREFSVKV